MKQILLIFLAVFSIICKGQLIYPHSEGFGSDSRAAYGGSIHPKILLVDNLSTSNNGDEQTGRGTFIWGITRDYPRIILFEISGTIDLTPLGGISIDIRSPYISIYGQTAPSPGITIRGGYLRFYTHDVLIQHIRFRTGDENPPEEVDCISMRAGSYNIVVNHCSMSWSVDECIGVNTSNLGHNITLSNCIVSEALSNSYHSKGEHSKAITILATQHVSIIKNLIAHHTDRSPFFNDGCTNIWVANNMIYNVALNRIYFKNEWNDEHIICYASIVGNYLKMGPDHTSGNTILRIAEMEPGSKVFLEDNYVPGVNEQWDMVINEVGNDIVSYTPIIWLENFQLLNVANVPEYIYYTSGARPLDRDNVDQRVIHTVQNGTGAIINSQDEVGGWPELEENSRVLTIPLNPHQEYDSTGYTNLEIWAYQYHLQLTDTTFYPVIIDHCLTQNLLNHRGNRD